jgi:hypothetical protein
VSCEDFLCPSSLCGNWQWQYHRHAYLLGIKICWVYLLRPIPGMHIFRIFLAQKMSCTACCIKISFVFMHSHSFFYCAIKFSIYPTSKIKFLENNVVISRFSENAYFLDFFNGKFTVIWIFCSVILIFIFLFCHFLRIFSQGTWYHPSHKEQCFQSSNWGPIHLSPKQNQVAG